MFTKLVPVTISVIAELPDTAEFGPSTLRVGTSALTVMVIVATLELARPSFATNVNPSVPLNPALGVYV